MEPSIGAITLFVADPRRAKAFYARAFEVAPVFEDDASVAFRFESTIVNLLRRESANELVEPARVAPGGAGASLQLTVWVEDCAAAVAEFRDRGVEFLNGPIDRPWGQRTAAFADPDGHVWELAQTLE